MVFVQYVDISDLPDPMLLDSGTHVASLLLDSGDAVNVKVVGDVWVTYNGKLYRNASEMPEELLKIFRTSPKMSDDIEIGSRNWYEISYLNSSDVIDDDGYISSGQLLDMMKEYAY